jgi:hypothetical protein
MVFREVIGGRRVVTRARVVASGLLTLGYMRAHHDLLLSDLDLVCGGGACRSGAIAGALIAGPAEGAGGWLTGIASRGILNTKVATAVGVGAGLVSGALAGCAIGAGDEAVFGRSKS